MATIEKYGLQTATGNKKFHSYRQFHQVKDKKITIEPLKNRS